MIASTPATEDRFERMGVGAPADSWEPVDAEKALMRLGDFYRDVDALLNYMRDGHTARTPFAYYRIAKAEGK